MEEKIKEELRKVAREREHLHRNHDSSRPLSKDYEYIGLLGEWEFAKFSHIMVDLERRERGDAGIDFIGHLKVAIDVKTLRNAEYLLVESGKLNAEIYVLAEYDDATDSARLIGWTWKSQLIMVEPRDTGRGVINHAVHRSNLRPMEMLKELLSRMR